MSRVPQWAAGGAALRRRTHRAGAVGRLPRRTRFRRTCVSEDGFRALVVRGPLDFAITGVISALSAPLAQAGIPIFVMSTFDTDYLLVRERDCVRPRPVLRDAGHEVFTASLRRRGSVRATS